MTEVLSRRALNRTLLDRQGLLARTRWTVDEAVERLVGMQAQAPLAPYVGLWSRIEGFTPELLGDRILDRRLVRATAMLRTTIHLHTVDDALQIRPLLQQVIERALRSSPFAKALTAVELTALVSAGEELLDGEALTIADVGRRVGERWPDVDPTALAYGVRYLVPLVQVPPRGIWGQNGPPKVTSLTGWLERPLASPTSSDLHTLIRRYLAAFGPATVADIAAWSWLTGLGEVVDSMRPQLATFRDDNGRELFDIADASFPDPDQPAPVRFLPEYDNVLLSHADRARIIPAGRRVPLPPGNGATMGTLLVDGFLRGTWRIRRERDGAAEMTIEAEPRLAPPEVVDVDREANDLLVFLAPERADATVRFDGSQGG